MLLPALRAISGAALELTGGVDTLVTLGEPARRARLPLDCFQIDSYGSCARPPPS